MEQQIPDNQNQIIPAKQSFWKSPAGIGVITAVVIVVAALAIYIGYKYKSPQPNSNNAPTNSVKVTDNPAGNASTSPAVSSGDQSMDAYLAQCSNRGGIVSSKSGDVTWQVPQKLSDLHIFASSTDPNGYPIGYQDISYLVGHVTGGKYAGGDFILSQVIPDGPSAGERYRLIQKDGKYYYLSKYSTALPDSAAGIKFQTPLIEDKDFDLPDLDFPQTLHSDSPSADYTYAPSLGFFQNGNDFFCTDYKIKVFSDPSVGDVYTDAETHTVGEGMNAYYPRQGFYVKAPDGSQRIYQLTIPIVGSDKIPGVVWSDGQTNSQQYDYQAIGGCGVTNFRDVVEVSGQDLVQIGTASLNNQAIYGYKDSNVQDLTDMYDQTFIPDGKTKPTYQEFVADHPIFFYKDQFGKYIRFKSSKYQPLAECGKPVIYLYPQQTERISVEVNPAGGMSESEPAYNQGWNVVSDSNSNITNLADGQIYPYLFWEGRGGLYQTPQKGFVVPQSGVHQLLEDKLSAFGLNQKERSDFEQFWEPKMQSKSYYFVTFMGNDIMDQIAPLNISPKPDTIIRVLMDFTPLDQPISAEGYNIRTPQRKGFTVVEWGGVLRQ